MKPILNVALDLSPLSDGNRQRGMGYYLRHLLPSLKSEIESNPNFSHIRLWPYTPPDPIPPNATLVHLPYFQPFFPSLNPLPPVPFVVTVPDLIPLELPHLFPVGLKGRLNWYLQKRRLNQAQGLITISHYSKHVISRLTRYPMDRIFVTHLAAHSAYKPISDLKILSSITKKYSLPPKFVFYVGDINTNKNIPLLVQVCRRLNYPLVIAGAAALRPHVESHPWNRDLIWLQQHAPQVVKLGFVPDSDMPALYSLATLYCQPSFSEGFGLGPLEAMACACPVVYAQATSLSEVLGTAGIPFVPSSADSLTSALTSLWTSSARRSRLSKLGPTHASSYSWAQTARSTLAVYSLPL